MSKSKVLFLMSGSIAAAKATEVISGLVKRGHEVRVAATPATLHFVGRATLEGLSQNRVLVDLYSPDEMMAHIEWTRWCDLAVLCPATGNQINRLALGLADDVVGAMSLALPPEKLFLIFPAMNSKMLNHPTVQTSMKRIAERGHWVSPTEAGPLACGETGEGRLLDPGLIIEKILNALRPQNRGRALITSGGTREKIDNVRFITNASTGATGARIAEALQLRGYEVVYLHGRGCEVPRTPATLLAFTDFSDFNQKLERILGQDDFDAIVHAAAVSDFSVTKAVQDNKELHSGKISSTSNLELLLRPNFKIVDRIKSYSRNKHLLLVAFKLTDTPSIEERSAAAQDLMGRSGADMVVHNDLSEMGEGHLFTVYTAAASCRVSSKTELAKLLSENIFLLQKRPHLPEVTL